MATQPKYSPGAEASAVSGADPVGVRLVGAFLRLRVSGLGFKVSGLGFKVSGLGFKVSGLGFRNWLLGPSLRLLDQVGTRIKEGL